MFSYASFPARLLGLTALSGGVLVANGSCAPATGAKPKPAVSLSTAMNPKIKPRIAAKVEPFALSQVRLLDGPFKHAQELDRTYLLSLEPDRLLHNFHKNAGITPKAPLYGGWESQGIAGHTIGHYLTALAEMYESTGDAKLKKNLDYTVAQLALAQGKSPDGYIGAAPDGRRVWDELKAGTVRASGFDLNGGWVPWYTQHKILAGLYDAYRLTGNEQAQEVLLKACDFALDVTAHFDDAKWREMLKAEHGGMNELLADVYALTGEKKYLDLAMRFSHSSVYEPLTQKRDALNGMHANTQIPKVIGFERIHQLEADPKMGVASRFFWQTVTDNRSFVTGGNSDREHFFAPEETARHLSADTAENCNVYNMLKLTQALYQVSPENRWVEFYERALFNQILSSQDPEKGGFNYLNSLKPGGFKVYSNPTTAFWCCVGSGMENHAKYGESIYFHDQNSLLVNLFIASKVNWAEKGVTLTQNTSFPDSDTAKFTISVAQPTSFSLKLRQPAWTSGAKLLINGKAQKVNGKPGSYETIARNWRNGDVVTWQLPMSLRSEGLVASPAQRAILYGPIVLAGTLGREGLDKISDYVDVQTVYSNFPAPKVPVLVSNANFETSSDWKQAIQRKPGNKLAFQMRATSPTGADEPVSVELIPFSRAHHV
ncbi:MAG TPA: glycoside hydrolase family 127 protein, partial [Abditibacterium sp.]